MATNLAATGGAVQSSKKRFATTMATVSIARAS